MVVDYRKVNSKIFYPMPSVEQAFEQFSGAVIFSIFDHNSANFQIPLTLVAVGSLLSARGLVCLNLIGSPWALVWVPGFDPCSGRIVCPCEGSFCV